MSKTLSLQDFRVMPFEKKCDVITYAGQFISYRSLGECKAFLYHTNGFFIEIFFSTAHEKILMINAFDEIVGLNPYLEQIHVDELGVDVVDIGKKRKARKPSKPRKKRKPGNDWNGLLGDN
jgi:hypothetical protein